MLKTIAMFSVLFQDKVLSATVSKLMCIDFIECPISTLEVTHDGRSKESMKNNIKVISFLITETRLCNVLNSIVTKIM